MPGSKRAVALLLALGLAALAAPAPASVPDLWSFDDGSAATSTQRCRGQLSSAVVRYADRVLDARRQCGNDLVRGTLPASKNCLDGRGDERLGRKLHELDSHLGRAGRACSDVPLEALGFPGACEDRTGAPFDLADFHECVVRRVDDATGALLDVWFPPLAKQPRGRNLACVTGAPRVAAKSFSQETAARASCLLGQVPGGTETNRIDCRALVPPYGDGTGDGATDAAVARADDTLDGLPEACSKRKLAAPGFPGRCVDGTGGAFTLDDLERCFRDANREAVLAVLAIVFPPEGRCGDGNRDPGEQCDDGNLDNEDGCSSLCSVEFCGDGVVQAGLGEECDDGIDNGNGPDRCRWNCRNGYCGDGIVDTGEACDDGNTIYGDGCDGCGECGDGIRSPQEECDLDASVCDPGEGCNIDCSCEPACPGVVELTLLAGYGAACSTNGDCPVGACGASGRCETATRLDSGWTGLAHRADTNDGVRLRGFLECDGRGPVCGECNFVGLDPSTGNCRCSNDPRILCDEPFAADEDHCAGSVCDCYAGPPLPLVAGGTPICVLSRFSGNVSGTVDVDLGGSELALSLKSRVYLGASTRGPCPVCGGTCSNAPATFCTRDDDCDGGTCSLDPVAGDGIRGGVCGGDPVAADHGLPCDVSGTNSHFPAFLHADGGGGYSLDCLPAVGKNISGTGLAIDLEPTTGEVSLPSRVSCTGPYAGLTCPCLTCSSNPTVACNSDDDCARFGGSCAKSIVTSCESDADCATVDVGPCTTSIGRCSKATTVTCSTNADCEGANVGACNPSTCSAKGTGSQGAFPSPNGCEDLLCTDLGGGAGECTTGPDTKYCAGVVRADGRGMLSCSDDSSCYPDVVGVDARPCSLVERSACSPAPIAASGVADPHAPVVVSTFCVPPTSGSGTNHVIGLPGPARLVQQMVVTTLCANDPGKVYEPGVGGCIESWMPLPKTPASEGKASAASHGR